MDLKQFVKDVPDYPKPGVSFKDITPLLGDKDAFAFAIDSLAAKAMDKKIDVVVGLDARGFIFAAPVAYKLGAGLAIVRKPGKLPRKTIREESVMEYASTGLEMHEDAIRAGENVLIVDDVLATGGTMEAACRLVKRLGGNIAGLLFLIELSFLQGRQKLEGYDVAAEIQY